MTIISLKFSSKRKGILLARKFVKNFVKPFNLTFKKYIKMYIILEFQWKNPNHTKKISWISKKKRKDSIKASKGKDLPLKILSPKKVNIKTNNKVK